MEAKQWMEERLWAYIDGFLNLQERKEVEQRLQVDPEWKRHYESLLELDRQFRSVTLEETPMRFTKNVMEQIASMQIAPATKSYVNKKIVYGVGAFFLLLIAACLVYVVPQIDFSQSTGTSSPISLDALSVDWSKYLNSTVIQVFFIIDAVAALFFLDRYLQRRKTRWSATENR